MAHHPHFFDLDLDHRFHTGKPTLVCGNTARMLQDTRYAPHFVVWGEPLVHYGEFDCAPGAVKAAAAQGTGGACC